MNYKTILLSLTLLLTFNGCSDSTDEKATSALAKQPALTHAKIALNKSIEKKNYTIDEIYNKMCIECHSTDGSGNTDKLTPSMVKLSQDEIFTALKDVENDKCHIIMEHNRGEILKMGMEYSAKDMAEYMHKRFTK